MMTKRGFLTGAASAAAAAATHGSWAAAPATAPAGSAVSLPQTPAAPAFDAVVFNDRYSDARAFAQALAGRGVPALAMAGDAGTLWHGGLGKRMAGGGRLAGIGTSMDLLILQSLGREAGLKLRFLAQHDSRGSRTLTHSLAGNDAPAAYAALAAELGAPDWAARLGTALPCAADYACAREALAAGTEADLRVATSVERSGDHPGMLLSWILSSRAVETGARQGQP